MQSPLAHEHLQAAKQTPSNLINQYPTSPGPAIIMMYSI
jgi:hypothetical protein